MKPGAERVRFGLARRLRPLRPARDEAPEELVERIVFVELRDLRLCAPLALLRRADVHDRGALLLDDLGEVRQLARLRLCEAGERDQGGGEGGVEGCSHGGVGKSRCGFTKIRRTAQAFKENGLIPAGHPRRRA